MLYLYKKLPQLKNIIPAESSPALHHHSSAPKKLGLNSSPANRTDENVKQMLYILKSKTVKQPEMR